MARKAVVSADALDDLQYELDEDLVGSFPATTAAGPSGSSVIGSEDGEGVDAAGATLKVAERQANPARASKPKKGKKRQHDAQNLDAGATEGLSSPPKKRKVDLADGSKQGSKRTKKGKGKEKVEEKKAKADKAKKGRTLQPSSIAPQEDVSIGLQPPDLQHLYLSDKQKRGLKGISDFELDAMRIPEAWLADVMGLDQRGNLGAWLASENLPGLSEAVKQPTEVKGSPVVLVVASAALRVADLCREVKPLVSSPSESGEVAKLFARHFKLAEHASHLRSHPVSIAVGTPDRLSKLLESDALSTSRVRWVLLDVTWTDAKNYSLLELPDAGIKEALWKGILGHAGLRTRLAQAGAKLVLF